MESIGIHTEYITLGQFLKLSGCIDTGGQAKPFLETTKILVNGEPDNRRGRKLYPEDKLSIIGHGEFVVTRG
jgi:S4 domain protein YaaA